MFTRTTGRERVFAILATFALITGAAACGGDDTADTTTAPTAPTSTTIATADLTVTVEVAAVYEAASDGSCSGAIADGEDFTYLTEGAAITAATDDGAWTGSLGPGRIEPNETGLEVCMFDGVVPGVPAGEAFDVSLDADSRAIAASGPQDVTLLYPHGMANGLGYEVVDWQSYPNGTAVWYTDIYQTSLILDGIVGSDDFLFGIGFALPTGSILTSPFDAGTLTWHVVRDPYASWYVPHEDGHRIREAHLGSATHQWGQQGTPGPDETGMWFLSTEDNYEIDLVTGGADVFELGHAEQFAMATGEHNPLQILIDGVEVILAFSPGGDDGFQYTWAHEDNVILDWFPYLAPVVTDPPQSEFDQGITLVTGPGCADCEEIQTLLDAAPAGLPVFTLTVDDRLPRMLAITDVPYVAALGPGQFDKMTTEGDEALGSIPDLIDRVCGWLGTCG